MLKTPRRARVVVAVGLVEDDGILNCCCWSSFCQPRFAVSTSFPDSRFRIHQLMQCFYCSFSLGPQGGRLRKLPCEAVVTSGHRDDNAQALYIMG
eukprot:4488226-Pyramimonas_sp.AAC.1